MKNKTRLLTILVVLTLTALACGQFRIGIEAQSNDEPNLSDNQIDNGNDDDNQNSSNANKPGNEAPKPSPTPPLASQFWKTEVDPRTGVRFAIPCYWVANIPTQEQDPTGLSSFSVNNFTQDFIFSLGPKRGGTVFEIGGMKFDLSYHKRSDLGLAEGAPLEEIAYTIVNPDAEHGITSTKIIQVNGKQVLQVETWSIFGEGRFYLLPTDSELVIHYSPSLADHPDFQGILYSFATSPEDPVIMPTHQPADPPTGMAAECMGILEPDTSSSDDSPATISSYPIDCTNVNEQDALMWTVCNVRDSFVSRNTQPLMGYMSDPFIIAYWQSEGATLSREEAFNEIVGTHLPQFLGGLFFTEEQSLFPPLFGMPPENMFGPDNAPDKIIYSEGWGQDQNGAALLYFKDTGGGNYEFYAMVIAQQHFDK